MRLTQYGKMNHDVQIEQGRVIYDQPTLFSCVLGNRKCFIVLWNEYFSPTWLEIFERLIKSLNNTPESSKVAKDLLS